MTPFPAEAKLTNRLLETARSRLCWPLERVGFSVLRFGLFFDWLTNPTNDLAVLNSLVCEGTIRILAILRQTTRDSRKFALRPRIRAVQCFPENQEKPEPKRRYEENII
jgi:hypothetical protein